MHGKGVGNPSCGAGPPGTQAATLPPPHRLVQRVESARSGLVPATFAPCGHTAPPPRTPRGHGSSAAITKRCLRRCRRPLPKPAANGNPPARELPTTAPSPRAPARSMPGRGSPPAPAEPHSTSGTPAPRSRTCAAATPPTSTAGDHHVARQHHAELAAAPAPAAPPVASATRRRRRSRPHRTRRPTCGTPTTSTSAASACTSCAAAGPARR